MKAKYDNIGIDYSQKRKSDPRIASQIFEHIKEAKKIINIGAGTGSYEPVDIDLIALEPSIEMIKQRSLNAHKVVQGSVESIPFEDNSFTHALTILSMHHWSNLELAFKEINRVASERFIAVSWNPKAEPFWLTKDYFPEIYEYDKTIFPTIDIFRANFNNVRVTPLLIPENCIDGFLAAYWKEPLAYLDVNIRKAISSFSKLENISEILSQLENDVKSKKWHRKNKSILSKSQLDAGYVIISADIRK